MSSRDDLRNFVQRMQALKEQKAELQAEMADEMKEMRSKGFSKAALSSVLKRLGWSQEKRSEHDQLVSLYETTLGGDISGAPGGGESSVPSPLSEAARKRLDESLNEKPDLGEKGWEVTQEDLDQARVEGVEACRAGENVIKNPYMFGDPRRGCWDEGWCAEAGSDGMDIPDAFRSKEDREKDKAKGGPGDGGAGEGPEDGEAGS